MKSNIIDSNLKKYIEDEILPNYSKNDQGHNLNHIKNVLSRSLKFASECKDINLNIVYTVACFHDIGHHIDSKNHEKVSADIVLSNQVLRQFFTESQIKTIAEAIEDHRASSTHEPRSIYGKIVSSADRTIDINDTLKRLYHYAIKHNKFNNMEDIFKECFNHCIEKFGKNGYAVNKIYFGKQEYQDYLNKLQALSTDYQAFKTALISANKLKKY